MRLSKDLIDKRGQRLLEYINDNIIMRSSGEVATRDSDFSVNTLDGDSLSMVMRVYNIAYKSIPFPLNLLDCDILYKVIGKVMVKKLPEGLIEDIYIYKGLNVVLDDKVLNLRCNNWTLVGSDVVQIRQGLNLDVHNKEITYEYFNWLLNIIDSIDLDKLESAFYDKYYRGMYEAVGRDTDLMYDSLLNVMLFNRDKVDKLVELGNGDIYNLNSGYIDKVKVFLKGYSKVKNEVMLVYDNGELKRIAKQVPVFGYEISCEGYERVDSNIYINLFRLLDYKRVSDGSDLSEEFSQFSGLYCNDKLIYNIDEKLYIEDLTRNKIKLIGTGLSVLGYKVTEYGINIYIRQGLGYIGNKLKGKVYKLNLLDNSLELSYEGLLYDSLTKY